jgi:hypothetical protein
MHWSASDAVSAGTPNIAGQGNRRTRLPSAQSTFQPHEVVFMQKRLLRAALVVAVVGTIPMASAADTTSVHFGPVTLVGTLYTDATRHIYLRLDQSITVISDRPSARGPSSFVNQREIDVAAIVSNRPINGVRVSATGDLEPGVSDSRPLMLAVTSTKNLP